MSIDESLFNGGADITGRMVEYWGDVWTVGRKNYCGDWDVTRRESRPTGNVKITSSIPGRIVPSDHPHFAKLLPTN